MVLVGELAHRNSKLARRQAVQRGDFACKRTQRSGLDVLLVRGLLEVCVVLLQRVVILPKLVEAGGLDQHPRVRPSQAGDSKHADRRRGYKKVRIVKRDRNLVQVAVFVAADEHDVVALFKLQAETLAQICPRSKAAARRDLQSGNQSGK